MFSIGGFLCQYEAKMEPVIFMMGPKTAGAKPIVAILPRELAIPEASPPFCIPTSIAIVRASFSFSFN